MSFLHFRRPLENVHLLYCQKISFFLKLSIVAAPLFTLTHSLRPNTHSTILSRMAEQDLVCPNKKYVTCSKPEIPGCLTTPGTML